MIPLGETPGDDLVIMIWLTTTLPAKPNHCRVVVYDSRQKRIPVELVARYRWHSPDGQVNVLLRSWQSLSRDEAVQRRTKTGEDGSAKQRRGVVIWDGAAIYRKSKSVWRSQSISCLLKIIAAVLLPQFHKDCIFLLCCVPPFAAKPSGDGHKLANLT